MKRMRFAKEVSGVGALKVDCKMVARSSVSTGVAGQTTLSSVPSTALSKIVNSTQYQNSEREALPLKLK
jgi:hypothetical protein